jgi:hypothetical protein
VSASTTSCIARDLPNSPSGFTLRPSPTLGGMRKPPPLQSGTATVWAARGHGGHGERPTPARGTFNERRSDRSPGLNGAA